jgi:lipopolysaccharide assembly outer membrane protein LptD (OstA)
MIKKRLFLLFFLISLFIAVLYAQEETPPLTEPASEEPAEEERPNEVTDSPANNRIRMEIKTSTISELALWCRTLGLSEGGTRDDLSKRLMEHFNLTEKKTNAKEKVKIITIESAQATEYFTISVIDEDYARLKGNVKIKLKDGDKEHKISADEILFNRTRNIITASGNVRYERTETGKTETFRGRSITVNIDNWSSIFIDGNTSMEDDGSSYRFSGSVIYRSDQDVTILRKATISSGEDDNEYWSIKSSRLWLLPGSDFAILNAILKVGEIPVLYIPFFYFPGDEVVFHPVIGYRSREGGFVQTTTYLIGQPKASSSETSSLTRIIGNSDNNEKELQGLFLRNTSRPIKNPNSASLKALFDYYVNLGTYTALELNTPKKGFLNPLDLNLGLGFTRTISKVDGNYTPYAPNYDGTFENNESNLFSKNVPFRYRMKFNSGISMKYGGFSWNIPYYSDPYVDRDFTTRAENMDWMNMIQQGAAFEEESSMGSEVSSYIWQMSGNLNPSFPILSPAVTNVSFSSISTTLTFKMSPDSAITNMENPNRYFYMPDRYVIYSISSSITGTPVTTGESRSTPEKDSNTDDDSNNDPFNGIGVPISPWAEDDKNNEKSASTEILIPPVLSQTFTMPSDGNLKFIIDYSISPTASSELQFMNKDWKTYEDVDWNEKQSILTSYGGNTNLNFRLDHSSGLFSNTVTLSGNGTWREYSYLNEEMYTDSNGVVDEKRMEDTRRQQYSQTNYAASYSYNGTLKPFYADPIFSQTNLQYSFRGTLVKSKKFTDGDGPELTPQWGEWVKEDLSNDILGLNSHRITTNFAANIMDKEQSISASAELPPLDELVTANAAFRVWITETILRYSMEKKETDEDWQIKPFYITENLKFGKIGSFSHNMTFTPSNDTTKPEEENKITYLNSSLSLWSSFTSTYTMTFIQKSVFKPDNPDSPHEGGKWEKEGERELLPKDLRFSYSRTFPSSRYFNNRFSLSYNISTSLNFDLQEHTSSNFQFEIGVTMGITKFMDLRISAMSQNAVIFRYFKGVQGMEELTAMYTEGEQNNVFTDLADSFNFFNEEKRKRTGFKMKRFNLKLEHLLGDWTASFEIGMYPHQKAGNAGENPTIEIVSDIAFFVHWKPITEIKSDINYDGKNDKWTVK